MKTLISAVILSTISFGAVADSCRDVAVSVSTSFGDPTMQEMLIPQCELGKKFRNQGRSVDSLVQTQNAISMKMRNRFSGKIPEASMSNTESAIIDASIKGYNSLN